MSKKQCVVPNCDNDLNQGITYHEFPKDRSLRESWLIALLMAGWRNQDTGVVCSRHFRREDLVDAEGRRVLRPGAVPMLYVQVCRICFRNNMLYLMTPYNMLCKAYETLAGFPMDDEYHLPPYVCYKCADRLLECMRFRHSSLRAGTLLQNIARDRGLGPRGGGFGSDCDSDAELPGTDNIYRDRHVGIMNTPDLYDISPIILETVM